MNRKKLAFLVTIFSEISDALTECTYFTNKSSTRIIFQQGKNKTNILCSLNEILSGKKKNREDYKEIEMRAEIKADKELTVHCKH